MHGLKKLGRNLMNTMGFILVTLFLMFFIVHHNQYQKLYPDGVESKYIEVEKNCSKILSEFAMPESIPNETTKFIRKPENPSGYISQAYTTTLTWEQIRQYHLDRAPKNGWVLKFDTIINNDTNLISFVRGGTHDRYAVDITLKGNKYDIIVGWHGLSITGK